MAKPLVLVLRTAGVNCELETAHAWEQAGAQATIIHLNELTASPGKLGDCQILTIPGGFSYGDDLGAGRIFANQLMLKLEDQLREFAAGGGLILGICNGFQVLCKAGLLPGRVADTRGPRVTVTRNISAKYEDRWVLLKRASQQCAFLSAQERYELPVAHGEGRVLAARVEDMHALAEAGCVALQYQSGNGGAVSYPDNPNGSMLDVAGLCDSSGRILGLMPHPERYVHHTQHPEWTSRDSESADGRAIFESAIGYLASSC